MSKARKSIVVDRGADTPYSKARIRTDGELYDRPEPDPFSRAWGVGYQDGIDGASQTPSGMKLDYERYLDGYAAGAEEREDLDSSGSSNA